MRAHWIGWRSEDARSSSTRPALSRFCFRGDYGRTRDRRHAPFAPSILLGSALPALRAGPAGDHGIDRCAPCTFFLLRRSLLPIFDRLFGHGLHAPGPYRGPRARFAPFFLYPSAPRSNTVHCHWHSARGLCRDHCSGPLFPWRCWTQRHSSIFLGAHGVARH